MSEALEFSSSGSLHLIRGVNNHMMKFKNKEGEPFMTVIVTADKEHEDPCEVEKFRKAKITVTVEYDEQEYCFEMK